MRDAVEIEDAEVATLAPDVCVRTASVLLGRYKNATCAQIYLTEISAKTQEVLKQDMTT